MAACQPTTLQLNTPIPTVGASLLAMAAYEPTNPQLSTPNPTVGAGLLAKAVCQSPQVLDVLMLSRASPLPQWLSCVPQIG